jgi:hypothetical protein
MEPFIIIALLVVAIVIAIIVLNPNAKARIEADLQTEATKIKALIAGLTTHTTAVVAALTPPAPAAAPAKVAPIDMAPTVTTVVVNGKTVTKQQYDAMLQPSAAGYTVVQPAGATVVPSDYAGLDGTKYVVAIPGMSSSYMGLIDPATGVWGVVHFTIQPDNTTAKVAGY